MNKWDLFQLIFPENEMHVGEFSVGTNPRTVVSTLDELFKLPPSAKKPSTYNHIDQLRVVACLCNAGEFDLASNHLPLNERKINGDATDQAILRFSESLGSVSDLRRMWKKTFELVFNSNNKFMIRVLELVEQEGLGVALPPQEAQDFDKADDL